MRKVITVNHEKIKENMVKELEYRLPSTNEEVELDTVINFVNFINETFLPRHREQLEIQDLLKDAVTYEEK